MTERRLPTGPDGGDELAIPWRDIAKVLHAEPEVQKVLPDELQGMSLEDFIRAFPCPFELTWTGECEKI